MGDNLKKRGQAICPECGQKIGVEVKNPRRKTQLIKCPICKKFSWTVTDKVDECMIQLARYEESGFYPEQLLALRILWKECMEYPELKQKLEEWEAKIGMDWEQRNKRFGGNETVKTNPEFAHQPEWKSRMMRNFLRGHEYERREDI